MSTKTVWDGPDIPKAQVTVFHRRFSGAVSLEQQLEDLTPRLPRWLRPLWKMLLAWLKPKIREAKIQGTMASVNRQAKQIGDEWARQDRQKAVAEAAARAIEQHPEAHVEVVPMPDHPVDVIYIEHSPTPGNKAQEALGFGLIEIRAPWVE